MPAWIEEELASSAVEWAVQRRVAWIKYMHRVLVKHDDEVTCQVKYRGQAGVPQVTL